MRREVRLDQLRVCFVAGTLGRGGAERQLYYMCQALTRSRTDVSVLSLTRGEHWEQPIRNLGVRWVHVGEAPSKAARLVRIAQITRRLKPDILQSQHFYTNLYVAVAARINGTIGIGAIRNDVVSEVAANGAVLGKLSLHIPQTLAANSEIAIANAERFGITRRRLFLIRNVVDEEHFHPEKSRGSTCIRLLSAGRLVEAKRHDQFLCLISELRQEFGDAIRGVVVGSGPLRSALLAQAHQLGLLPSAVELIDSVEDMRPIYRGSDFLVVCSDHEGTPNVALEAMASGIPVIATNVGGIPAVVDHRVTGLLSPRRDRKAMYQNLQWALQNRTAAEIMARKARLFIEQNHSQSRLPEHLHSLYEHAFGLPDRQSGFKAAAGG